VKTSRHLHLMAATGTIRTAMFEEREHVVVPVVALVEGVMHAVNSPTPELVLAEEFSRVPEGWNGRPVLPDHPALGGMRTSANDPQILETQAFGRVFHTRADSRRLMMEAWLDPARAEKVGAQRMMERIRAGEMLEVSVGVFIQVEEKSGVFEGRRYMAIWRDIVPDHLALLPEGTLGACNNAMGCGTPRAARVYLATAQGYQPLSAAAEEGTMEEKPDPPKRSWRDKLLGLLRGAADEAATEGVSDSDLRSLLDQALRAVEAGYLGIESVFVESSTVVYAVAPEDRVEFLMRSFEMTEGAVTLGKQATEVKPVTRFEPVTAASSTCGCGGVKDEKPAGGEDDMKNVKDRVAAIIASGKTSFTAASAAVLEKLPEAELKALEDHIEAPAPTPTPTPAPAPAAVETPAPKELSQEEMLAKFPDIKAIVERERSRAASRKAEIVTAMAGKQDAYTQAELEEMPLEQLEKVFKLSSTRVAAAVDHAGRGLPRQEPSTTEIPRAVSMTERFAALNKKTAS
jgi:hypothetical protein